MPPLKAPGTLEMDQGAQGMASNKEKEGSPRCLPKMYNEKRISGIEKSSADMSH